MAKTSAGLLIYRKKNGKVEVLLVHPGGPFWARKDAWGIPKGLYKAGEDPLLAAQREFAEEIGQPAPTGQYINLGQIKNSGGKTILAFAVEGDLDVRNIVSNTVSIEWPPRSSQQVEVPEADRAEYKSLAEARLKMHKGQAEFIERLAERIDVAIEPTQLTQSSLF